MQTAPDSLRSAFEIDLARLRMSQAELGERLDVSQQSISKWLAADNVPEARRPALLEILGPQSATAAMLVQRAQTAAAQLMGHAEGVRFSRRSAGPSSPPPDDVPAPLHDSLRRFWNRSRAPETAPDLPDLVEEIRLLREALPSDLARHITDEPRPNEPQFTSGQLSVSVAVYTRFLPTQSLARPLVRLAAIKARDVKAHPGMQYMLAVRLPPAESIAGVWTSLMPLVSDCNDLGILLAPNSHPAELAAVIASAHQIERAE